MSAERAQQLVEAGVWLKLSGDLDGAKRLFEQALKLDPGNEKAKELLGAGTAPEFPSFSGSSQSNMFNRPPPTAADPTTMENDWGMATGFNSGIMKMPDLPAVAPIIAPAVAPKVAAAPKMPSVNIRIDGDAVAPAPFSSAPLFGVPPPAPAEPPAFSSSSLAAVDSGIDFSEDEAPAPLPSPPRPPADEVDIDVDVSSASMSGVSIDVEAVTEPELAVPRGSMPPPPAERTFAAQPPAERTFSAPPVFDADAWDLPPEPEEGMIVSSPTMVFGTPLPAQAPPVMSSPSAQISDLDLDIEVPVEEASGGDDAPIDVQEDVPPSPSRQSAIYMIAADPAIEVEAPDDRPGSGVEPAPAPPHPSRDASSAAPSPTEPPPPPVFDSQVDAAWRWPTPEPFPVAPPDTSPQFPSLKDLPAPMPSPNLAPFAESAWDARANPGIKLESVAPTASQQDTPIDILASDRPHTPEPVAGSAQVDVETLLRAAKDLLDLDDHSGAMELILKAQVLAPNDPHVNKMREKSEATLLTMFESKLGGLESVPKVVLKEDEIIWLNLDHRAGFVLAQIDGTVSFEDLFAVSGMARLDTARILVQLIDEGVVSRG